MKNSQDRSWEPLPQPADVSNRSPSLIPAHPPCGSENRGVENRASAEPADPWAPQQSWSAEMPRISPVLWWGFQRYTRRYLRRNFHAVRVARDGRLSHPPAGPVVCYANHPSWWDPLMAVLLHRLYFPGGVAYAPIDELALAKYPVFRRLGFYGIDLQRIDGARRFLRVTRELLRRPDTVIWMTPGGRFADVRQGTEFQPGLSHLAARLPASTLIPIAVEYTFWDERTPEAFVAFGEAISTGKTRRSKEEWQSLLQTRLAEVQGRLARCVISRDAGRFDTVLTGTAGIGGLYDWRRRIGAWLRGRSFDPRHGVPDEVKAHLG